MSLQVVGVSEKKKTQNNECCLKKISKLPKKRYDFRNVFFDFRAIFEGVAINIHAHASYML